MTDRDGLSAAKRELLQRRLQGRARMVAGPRPVSRRVETGPAPLSVTQEQLWYIHQLAPDSTAYNEAVTIRKDGAFDPGAFRLAFNELLHRHEIWRTSFELVDGVPVQVVGPPPQFPLPLVDLSGLSYDAAESRAADLAAADFGRPYDLARGPLVRPHLVRLSADHHRLYLGLHHIIFDGVSLYGVILPELVTLYDDFVAGRSPTLSEPPVQYSDYAVWEREWVATPAVTDRTEWWRQHLIDVQPLELPLDRPRPMLQRFRGGMEPFTLERELVDGLRELGRRRGATLFQTLATGFAALLHRYSGQDDVTFGTVGDLRQRPELQRLVGYCLTSLVLRADVRNDPTFEQLLDRFAGEIIEGLDHLVPFERLVRELRPVRDGRSNPIFQVTLVLEPKVPALDSEWSLHLMEVEIGNGIGSAKFDLSVECDERPEGHISGRLIYDTDLFSASTARQLARHWHRLLVEVLADPTAPVSRLTLLTADESRQQLEEWNRSDLDPVATRTVHDLVTDRAQRAPDAVALVQGGVQLTYRQLDQRADDLARRLRKAGAGPGVIVGICLERSPDMVVGLLGVLKSGAAYLPLDPRLPVDRLAFMMEDAGAGALLTQRQLASLLPTVAPAVLLIDDWAGDAADRGDGGNVGDDRPSATPESVAYVMYTSGSTGRPKGVLVRHRNVVNYLRSVVAQPGLDHGDVALAVTTYAFDMSVGDIFAPLIAGARIVLASSEEAADVRRLARLIDSSGATYLKVTPVTWQALVEAGWTGSRSLVAVSGGDSLSEPLARQVLARVGQLWITYGPTETTVTATCTQLHAGDPVTLGRPIANARVYVLDRHGSLVPVGVAGEICIGGAGVTAGYLNRPDETTQRFQQDPFHPGETMYRSGDLGRYLPDGRIQFLGRADDQLKIRGFRIEPGEVEAALLACEGVSAAAVRADGVGAERRLLAFVVPRGSEPPTGADLRSVLRRSLPDYMVPSAIVWLPALPTTTSGKVDRRALAAAFPATSDDTVPARPTSALEDDLARIWARVLGVERVDVDASFFDLGGHSLLAVRALLEVERELGVEVPLPALFQSGASVRGVASTIAATRNGGGGGGHRQTPLFFVHPQPATVPSMRHFTGPLGVNRPIEALLPERPTGRFDLSRSVPEMTRPLLQSVRAVQPSGPYLIAGYSFGGVLAYELATQLIAAGESVAWLGLLDTPYSGALGRRPSQAQLFLLYASRGWRVLLRQCRSALRRELRSLRVRVRPDPHVFDYRGAEILRSRYAPQGNDARLAVFATDAMVTDQRFGPSLGWERVHKGPLEKHAVPGNHESLLLPPNVQAVAEVLSASVSAAAAGLDDRAAAWPV